MNKTERMSAAQYREYISGGTAESGKATGPGNDTSYKNRVSSEGGRGFEELIKKGCEYYAGRGRAMISKVHEPYIVTKILPDGGFIGKFIGRAEPDFKGVLKGGQAIAFEAKSTSKSRIQRSVLTPEQMQWLDAQMMMGALTYVCVGMTDKQKRARFFMIPWHTWADMKIDYGKKFLMPDDIPEYEVRFDGTLKFLDYVSKGSVRRGIDG